MAAGSSPYSSGMLNVVRLLSAASLLSSMLAVWQLGSREAPGRVLIVLGVLTSLCGQLFVMQASKPSPPAWVNVPLTLLGIGLGALLVAWAAVLAAG